MRLVFVFTLILPHIDVSLCLDQKVNVPEDNSHYKEGHSRYIWINEEENSSPRIEDLWYNPKPEEKLKGGEFNEYYIYTSKAPYQPLTITYGKPNSIRYAGYNPKVPLNVVTHGYMGSASLPSVLMVKNAFMASADCNVIALDWSKEANLTYKVALDRIPGIGEKLGKFVSWLIKTGGGDWSKVHFVGYGLGAHVVGAAGRHTTPTKPNRITGLSPTGYDEASRKIAIRAGDGEYVEIIHTYDKAHDIDRPIGNVDFFVNGGGKYGPQPGCLPHDCLCSASRSYKLFAAGLIYHPILFGRRCKFLKEARDGKCVGSKFKMGGDNSTKRGSGIYGLWTTSTFPYQLKEF